jgi:hypothetical protein
MIVAFSGSVFGSSVGLQEFGLGPSVAILLDAPWYARSSCRH